MRVRWGLRGKLLASYGLVIAVAVGATGLAARWLWVRHTGELSHQAAMSGTMTIVHFADALDRALLGAGLAAFAVAVLLGLLLSGLISAPLRQMTVAARRLAAGDYEQRVTVRSDDEVGELAAAFNEMAAGLARVEQMRRELVANVAHELRTPLTSIEGYMEALLDGVFPADEATFRRVQREAARLRRLVEDLTELARVESPEFRLERRPVLLDQVVREAVAQFQPRFAEKTVALQAHLPPEPVTVLGDADRLNQVLVNLLANALQFTPEGGQVEVVLQEEDRVARLAVRDTGCGIAPEDLPHIFERFYRGDRSRARTTGGAGIGLTIVKHIVERHGGTISVESQVGEGSTFQVVLPANS